MTLKKKESQNEQRKEITNDQANVKNNYIELFEMKKKIKVEIKISKKKKISKSHGEFSILDTDGESKLEARYE